MSYHYDDRAPIRIPLPFVRKQQGLGDAIKRLTGSAGVRPCGGCEKRANWLNRRVQLVPRRKP